MMTKGRVFLAIALLAMLCIHEAQCQLGEVDCTKKTESNAVCNECCQQIQVKGRPDGTFFRGTVIVQAKECFCFN